ncbi:hypothetical protein [Streptomyces sp. NPDC047928]|uniref:LppU/SCO3897 family protein n=1 Tax=unclassified Streptomyces TaxID=2593676 RepID=UPI0037109020
MATPPPPHAQDPQQVPPSAEGFGEPVAPDAPAKRKGGVMKKVLRVVALIVVAIAVKFGISYFFNAPVHAKAGDCVSVTGSENDPKVETKGCTDKDANYKVVKLVEGTFDTDACENVADAEAALAQQWEQEKFVLCLKPVK